MIETLSRHAWHLCAALLLAFFVIVTPDASAQPSTANTAGRWNATFQWDDAGPGQGAFVLNSDGTFTMEDYEYTGRWRVRGNTFWLRIDQPPNSVYSGVFQGDSSISGTLRNDAGRTGTFTFTRAGSGGQSGDLPENFDLESARRALTGDRDALLGAFVFEGTPQGHAYWYAVYESRGPLPAEAEAQLRAWIALAEAGGSSSTGGKGGAVSGGAPWRAIAGDWELTQNLQGNTCSRYYRFVDNGSYLDWFTGETAGELGHQTDASNFRDVGGGRIFYNGYDDQYFQIIGGELVRTNADGTRYCTFHRLR